MLSADLTIGALAAQTGCNVPTVRYYEEVGLLPTAQRRPSGHRVYGDTDLRRLTFIRRCRDFGFSIDQVRVLLSLTENPSRNCDEARGIAQTHLDEVRLKLAELRSLEQSLMQFVESCTAACAGGPAGNCVILTDLVTPTENACCG